MELEMQSPCHFLHGGVVSCALWVSHLGAASFFVPVLCAKPWCTVFIAVNSGCSLVHISSFRKRSLDAERRLLGRNGAAAEPRAVL